MSSPRRQGSISKLYFLDSRLRGNDTKYRFFQICQMLEANNPIFLAVSSFCSRFRFRESAEEGVESNTFMTPEK